VGLAGKGWVAEGARLSQEIRWGLGVGGQPLGRWVVGLAGKGWVAERARLLQGTPWGDGCRRPAPWPMGWGLAWAIDQADCWSIWLVVKRYIDRLE